jgi:malate dehydrogenase
VLTREVDRVTVWGNHSATMFPDFTNARIQGKPATQIIPNRSYLETEFIPTVQQRGTAVINARGASSAASAANAIIDSVVSLTTATPGDDWHSVALCSDGSYGVPEGLICSFPTRFNGSSVEIVQNVPLDAFAESQLKRSVEELQAEKEMTAHLLP